MADKDNPARKKRAAKKATASKKNSARKSIAKKSVTKNSAANKTAIYNWSVDVAISTTKEEPTQQEPAQQAPTQQELNKDDHPKPVRVLSPFPPGLAESSETLSMRVQERRERHLATPQINYPPDFETEEEFHAWMLRGNHKLGFYFWSSIKSCTKHGHWIERDESIPEVPESSSLPATYLRRVLGGWYLELHALEGEVLQALRNGEKLCCKGHEYLVDRLKKLEAGELRMERDHYC